MCGRIEIRVCCAALLAGATDRRRPGRAVPGCSAEVTALFGVDGTHNDTEVAACATAPPGRTRWRSRVPYSTPPSHCVEARLRPLSLRRSRLRILRWTIATRGKSLRHWWASASEGASNFRSPGVSRLGLERGPRGRSPARRSSPNPTGTYRLEIRRRGHQCVRVGLQRSNDSTALITRVQQQHRRARRTANMDSHWSKQGADPQRAGRVRLGSGRYARLRFDPAEAGSSGVTGGPVVSTQAEQDAPDLAARARRRRP